MPTVVAHQLERENPQEDRDDLIEGLEESQSLLPKRPQNLGPYFRNALDLAGFEVALRSDKKAVLTAIGLARDFGVALFARGSASSDQKIRIKLRSEWLEVSGGMDLYQTAPSWIDGFSVALVLRDDAARASLREFDWQSFQDRETYDPYFVDLARSLSAVAAESGDADQLLTRAHAQAEQATLVPDFARRVGLPLVELAQAICARDQARFTSALVAALEGHAAIYRRKKDANRASGVLPMKHVGLCALAHDRGLKFEIESEYVPTWLVRGEFPNF